MNYFIFSDSKRIRSSWLLNIATVFLLGFACFQLTSCSKDESTPNSIQSEITVRTCAPGSFTYSSGRIVFDSLNAFLKTFEYINCVSSDDVADWSDGLTIKTVARAEREYRNLICDDNLTYNDYLDYKTEYSDYLTFYTDGNGDDEYTPKYKVYKEFINEDGEFQIGNTVIKVLNNHVASIVDPITTPPSTVTDATVSDSVDGVFMVPFALSLNPPCCPTYDSEVNVYANNPRKRLKVEYRVAETSIVVENYKDEKSWLYVPSIEYEAESRHHRRRTFALIGYWACEYANLKQDFSIEITTQGLYGLPSTISDSDSRGPDFVCLQRFHGGEAGSAYEFFWTFIPGPIQYCIEEVSVLGTNVDPNPDVTAEIDCN